MRQHLPLTQEVIDNKDGFKILSYDERDSFVINQHDLVFDKVIKCEYNYSTYFVICAQMKCVCGFTTTIKTYSAILETP